MHLPVPNVPPHAQHELLNHPVKDVGQGEERQEAVIGAHLDVPQVHKALKRGHSSHQSVVRQHDTLGVACITTWGSRKVHHSTSRPTAV